MKITKLVTHDGAFHADDILATIVLLGIYRDATVVRSRDPQVWADGDIVYDVGGGKYDHHMVNNPLREDGTPYSSFGLIWRDFGKEYLNRYTDVDGVDATMIDSIWETIDSTLVRTVDLDDNGVVKAPAGHLIDLIKASNATHIEGKYGKYRFEHTIEMFREIFYRIVLNITDKHRSFSMVEKSYVAGEPVLILDEDLPWKDFVESKDEILYVVYPSNGIWRANAASIAGTFQSKKPFPVAWRGLNNDALVDVCGVEGATFCHRNGFTCGNVTKDGIMKMVEACL